MIPAIQEEMWQHFSEMAQEMIKPLATLILANDNVELIRMLDQREMLRKKVGVWVTGFSFLLIVKYFFISYF